VEDMNGGGLKRAERGCLVGGSFATCWEFCGVLISTAGFDALITPKILNSEGGRRKGTHTKPEGRKGPGAPTVGGVGRAGRSALK